MSIPVGLALTGLGLFGQSSARKKTQRAQDAAIEEWLAYQRDAKDVANAAVDANREANYGYLGGALDGATLEARQNLIGNEENRLFGLMDPGDEGANITYSNDKVKNYAGRTLAEATREARDMLRANARTRAYTGSYGGMGNTRRQDMQTAAEGIGFGNEMSMGDLRTLAKRQTVQPVMYQHQSSGLGELMSSIGSGMLGTGLANMGAGAAAAAPSATTVSTGSGWTPTSGGYTPVAPTSLGFGAMPPLGYLYPYANRPQTYG